MIIDLDTVVDREYKALWFVVKNLMRWGRINVSDWKEKYGSLRVYCTFGWYEFHTLVHPGRKYVTWPTWVRTIDIKLTEVILERLKLSLVVFAWQKLIYNVVYHLAFRLFPDQALKLYLGMDYPEHLWSRDRLEVMVLKKQLEDAEETYVQISSHNVDAMVWQVKAETLNELVGLIEMTEVNNFPDRREEILSLCQKRSGIMRPEESTKDEKQE